MPQNYTPEYKKLFVFVRKKDVLTKASQLSTAYPKPAFPSGVANSVKNAKQKPSRIRMQEMKWSL